MIIWKMPKITGKISLNPKMMKTNRMINPYLSRECLIWSSEDGNTANSNLEPSRGGMGIRLNTAKRIFAYTKIEGRAVKLLAGKYRSKRPNPIATRIFDAGPARAIFAGPHF